MRKPSATAWVGQEGRRAVEKERKAFGRGTFACVTAPVLRGWSGLAELHPAWMATVYATSTRTCGAASQGNPRADAAREQCWPAAAAASGDRRGEAGGERHLLLALRGHRKRGLCVAPGLQRPLYVDRSSMQC